MKALVTGGAGFIGSHIVDALLKKGDDVVVVDDLSNGSERNINPAATFYRFSINDNDLAAVFHRERPQVVVHHAAHVVVTESVRDPILDARVNILGSLNLILNCINYNVKKIVYASSCAIYGDPQYLPLDEKHPLDALSPYGVSKHTVEHYLQSYHTLSGLQYVALRYSNVYGPRQNPHGEAGVVAIFATRMLAGEQPIIFGQGNKTRSYVFVGDIVRANLLAIDSEKSGVYNIGTREETTDQKIFDAISSELGYRGRPKYDAERPGEIQRMCLDASKAQAELGWAPLVPLEEGIKITADYYRIPVSATRA